MGDETFRDLVIARIVEPTSILDTGQVLTDLGVRPSSESTMRRTLKRANAGKYRDQIAGQCFEHALTCGDVSLCQASGPTRRSPTSWTSDVGGGWLCGPTNLLWADQDPGSDGQVGVNHRTASVAV